MTIIDELKRLDAAATAEPGESVIGGTTEMGHARCRIRPTCLGGDTGFWNENDAQLVVAVRAAALLIAEIDRIDAQERT